MLLNHLEGILNYCRTKVLLVAEAVNSNIKSLRRRGRSCRNLNYLLLKAQCHRSPRAGCTETRFLKIRLYLIDFTREQTGLRVAMRCSFTIDCQRYEEE